MNWSASLRTLPLVLLVLLTGSGLAQQPDADKKTKARVKALIDKLTEVADGDVGYSASVSGTAFTPLNVVSPGAMLLGQKPSVRSETLRELVKLGPAALPHLIAHLGDKRRTRIAPVYPTLGGYGSQFDINPRVEKKPKQPKDAADAPDAESPPSPTVGDPCYVAIGQIVNRDFSAVAYMPSLHVAVSSPTHSRALREGVKERWGSMTPEKHKASLVGDFLNPDSRHRRIGACLRLAYYHPQALETVALKFLAEPGYDHKAIYKFVREELYKAKNPEEGRRRFDAYLRQHGEVSRDGILVQLFDDLKPSQQTEGEVQARKLLIQLYGKKEVKSEDRPLYLEGSSSFEKAEVLKEGFIHDESAKIDKAVRDLLVSTQDDDLALACMQRLLGRGFDAAIEDYCRRRLPHLQGDWKELFQAMLARIGWTRLHVAVERKDVEAVRHVLGRGVKPGTAAKNGQTALHLAATLNTEEIAKVLLDAGAPINAKDREGRTAVQLACVGDHVEVMRVLVSRGCEVTDLLVAAAAGKDDVAAALLKKEPDSVAKKTTFHRTPLHLAAVEGHVKVATLLLAHKATVDARDEAGWTPLHFAVFGGHEAIVRLLIANKANVRAVPQSIKVEPIHMAAAGGKTKIVEALLSAKADLRATADPGEVTPLHAAASQGHTETAALLLKKGAAVDVPDEQKRTPLHFAAQVGHVGVATLLLDKGAAVDAGDAGQRTPLLLAAQHGHAKIAKLLLERKAKVNAVDNGEMTPLHCAAMNGHADVVKVLLEHKAMLSPKDQSEATPLHYAQEAGHQEVVKLLKTAGAKE